MRFFRKTCWQIDVRNSWWFKLLFSISKLFMRGKSTRLACLMHLISSFGGGSKFKMCWELDRDWSCLFHGNTPNDRNLIYHPCSFGARQFATVAISVMFDCPWHRRDVDQTLRFISSFDVQCLIIFQYGASHFVESSFSIKFSPTAFPPSQTQLAALNIGMMGFMWETW